MRPNVVVINYATPLSEAARTLSEGGISGAPVVDEAGHIVGILSMKDLVGAFASLLAEGEARTPEMPGFADRPKSGEDIAGDLMNAEIYSVPAEAKLQEIAKVMTEHQIHRVLVERNGKHVGLISTMEIMNALCA
jgi:CBS domain-containing protein